MFEHEQPIRILITVSADRRYSDCLARGLRPFGVEAIVVDGDARSVLDAANHLCPDIVHVHDLRHASLAWRAPVVATIRSSDPDQGPSGASPLRVPRAVVAPDERTLALAIREFGPFQLTRVIPDAISESDAERMAADYWDVYRRLLRPRISISQEQYVG